MHSTIIDAINSRRCLTLTYDGYTRLVEPHAYGRTKEGHGVVRVWQVRGGSAHNEPTGWKLLRTDEIHRVTASTDQSGSPRHGYKRGDPVMAVIYAQA